jgi:uncharacterized protein (DUF433 family)
MPEIVRDDDVMGGDPRLEGHRISVLQVADLVLDADHSPEYVADQLGLTLAEVHAALSYYYDNPSEMESVRERHRDLEATLADRAVDPDTAEH